MSSMTDTPQAMAPMRVVDTTTNDAAIQQTSTEETQPQGFLARLRGGAHPIAECLACCLCCCACVILSPPPTTV